MKKPMTLILFGGIIVLIGGLIAAIGTYLYNKNSSEKSDRIESSVIKNIGISETTKEDVNKLKKQNDEIQNQVQELMKVTTAKIVDKPIEAIKMPPREMKPAFITNPFFITNTVGPNNIVNITNYFSYRCIWYGSEVIFLVKVANEKSELSFSFNNKTVFPYTIVLNSQGKICMIQIFNKTDTYFQVKTYSD